MKGKELCWQVMTWPVRAASYPTGHLHAGSNDHPPSNGEVPLECSALN